jgi:hypothetical protein
LERFCPREWRVVGSSRVPAHLLDDRLLKNVSIWINLTPWGSILLEKLTVVQLVKIFLAFIEFEILLS